MKKGQKNNKFNHEAWLKQYIDMKTGLRKNTKHEFLKWFFQVDEWWDFCKSIENVRKYRNINLTRIESTINYLVSELKRHKKNSGNLWAVEMKRTQKLVNEPGLLDLSILQISKLLMHK